MHGPPANSLRCFKFLDDLRLQFFAFTLSTEPQFGSVRYGRQNMSRKMPGEDGRAAKRRRSYTSKIIMLHAGDGDGDRTVSIHEDNLCEFSPFFRAALENKRWKEGREGEVDLPDDHVDTVTAYAHWLYHQEISDATLEWDDKLEPDHEFLISLWLFGDKVQDDKFCDAVLCKCLDAIEDGRLGTHVFPSVDAVRLAYEGTTAASPLRQCLATIFADNCETEWLSRAYPEDFKHDLLEALIERRGSKDYKSYSQEERSAWMKQK
ncbi:hypothetical protein AC578_6133 [Pseudocercospora eumusae]|uniref:BTB domain-containing protein n=1 Tax=Pseudocercospora eumusae TaxID=321146 RepID=A0A139GXL0_9PEZI|nr:hypothetical protein AC578_6133 [Pseudocercospora eumusae]